MKAAKRKDELRNVNKIKDYGEAGTPTETDDIINTIE